MNSAQTLRIAVAAGGAALLLAGYLFVSHYNAKADADELAALADPKLDKGQACKKCEEAHCGKLRAACVSPESKLVYECIEKNHCGDPAQDDLSRCYCGDTDKTECFMGGGVPKGPCKDVMDKAAKTTSALEVGQRFYDMQSELGQGVQFANCRASFCKECD